MKTIKPLRIGVLTRTFEYRRKYVFAVTPIVCVRLGEGRDFVTEVDLWKALAKHLGEGVPFDEAMPKANGELLVTGSAHAAAPTAAMIVSARVGDVSKRLRVTGDRYWLHDDEMSRPTPFTEMPLSWSRAFGGEGFARNPLGRGAVPVETPYGLLRPLPNVEAPDRLHTAPGQREEPAGFGAYDFTWPQRASKLGTYDDAWLAQSFPGFADDVDWSAFNAAPADQQIRGWWRGDEPYTLEGLTPGVASVSGRLPGVRARVFVTQRTGETEGFFEVPTRLDTVHMVPTAGLAVLLFRGVHSVATDDGSDILHLVLACEDLDEARPVAHYQTVLAQRLDKKTGALHAFRDRDLMPASTAGAPFRGTDEMAEMEALLRRDRLLTRNLQRRSAVERQRARDELVRHGLDPATIADEPTPAHEELPALDELPEVAARADAMVADARAQAAAAVDEALARYKASCLAMGVDPERAMAGRGGGGGPPQFSAAEAIYEMRRAARADRSGRALAEVEGALTPEKRRMLDEAEAQIREAYRMAAHEQPPADPIDAERALSLRDQVAAMHRAGEPLARVDLTGADLSGLDLRGADLRGSWLEGASLRGARLDDAWLEGAVLARADLEGASALRAKLQRANLGAASLRGAQFAGADLREAILSKADAQGASFDGAQMARADLRELRADGARFAKIEARDSMWLKVGLAGVDLSGCSLEKCLFIECDVQDAVFDQARLAGAVFMGCKGDAARFVGAQATSLRAVQGTSFAGADFTDAVLERANFRGSLLQGASFNRATLTGADLSECNLAGARFYRASMREGRMTRANLTGATMISFQMMMGLLTHAMIQDADFTDANLFRADLLGVRGRARSFEGAELTQVRHVTRDA